MGCSFCKPGQGHLGTPIAPPTEHVKKTNEQLGTSQNGSVSPTLLPLATSVPSTAASPHHVLKKEILTVMAATVNIEPEKDSLKSTLPLNFKTPAVSKLPSSQISSDYSAIETQKKPNRIIGCKTSIERDVSSCRLKKKQDITEEYSISQSQILGTGDSSE